MLKPVYLIRWDKKLNLTPLPPKKRPVFPRKEIVNVKIKRQILADYFLIELSVMNLFFKNSLLP
jgi:hypothetical protein